jgi:hypothetical protein
MNWPNNCDCGTCVALWHELSRRRYGPSLDGWEGLHSDVRSVRAHAVRWRTTHARHAHVWAHAEQFLVETPARLGGAQRTGLPSGRAFLRRCPTPWSWVAMCACAAGERAGNGRLGGWSERGVDGPHRACALSDGRGHTFHRRQADVPGGEYGGHAGLKRQRCAPQR